MSKIKFLGIVAVFVGVLLITAPTSAANDVQVLQPVAPAEAVKIGDLGSYFDEYSSYMQLSTALHSSETMHIPDIHIGGTDGSTGGVTFFNGTIINASEGDYPVTFGDDVRIDGMIWRDQKGTASDNRPVLFGDSVSPALDAANLLGESGKRWKSLYISDNIFGKDIIHEDNLAVTNSATKNQILAYAGNNQFKWTNDIMRDLSSSAEDGEIVVRDGDSWTTRDITRIINHYNTTEGDTELLDDLLSSLSCADSEIIVYNAGTTSWECGSIAGATGNTLDEAYDQGGAGDGRTIIADSGAVFIDGVAGTNALNVKDGDLMVDSNDLVVITDAETTHGNEGQVGIGTNAPVSMLHVVDDGTDDTTTNDNYAQLGRHGGNAPLAVDCNEDKIGRIFIDNTDSGQGTALYICMGTTRGWDSINLN